MVLQGHSFVLFLFLSLLYQTSGGTCERDYALLLDKDGWRHYVSGSRLNLVVGKLGQFMSHLVDL